MDGRVLQEALIGGATRPDKAVKTVLTSQNAAGRQTHLSVTDFAGVRYLNRAWVE
jgi:hypothetical protein